MLKLFYQIIPTPGFPRKWRLRRRKDKTETFIFFTLPDILFYLRSRMVILCTGEEVTWSEVAQSCPTLCDPMDCSLPGFSVHGIFQARVLEWGAIAFSMHWRTWPHFEECFLNWLICFNWRIITLQYWDGFCHTATWIDHRYTCVPPSWTPLSPPPSLSFFVVPEHWLQVLCFTDCSDQHLHSPSLWGLCSWRENSSFFLVNRYITNHRVLWGALFCAYTVFYLVLSTSTFWLLYSKQSMP